MQIEGRFRIRLIRHGETEGNRERRYVGCRTDEPLSEEGRRKLSELLSGEKDRIRLREGELLFTGSMLRCRQTAETLFPDCAPTVLPDMREIDFGLFEGKNHEELDGDPGYQAWIDSGGRMGMPGGDTPEAFILRTMRSFREMLCRMTEKEKPEEKEGTFSEKTEVTPVDTPELTATLVCHGGNIMAIMSSLTGDNYYDHLVKNGDGYELSFSLTGEEIHDLSYHRLYPGRDPGSADR